MLVKNKKSGEIEGMDYDAAQAAVTAGTHVFVNLEEKDGALQPKPDKAKEPHPPAPDELASGDVVTDPPAREVEDDQVRPKRR